MPVISGILAATAIASAVSGGVGLAESASASGSAQNAANANTNIAQQELADKQQVFQQLDPLYSQYLGSGSPYLQNIQRQGAEQNATQYNNAAGQLRQTMGQSGLGYGPSGTTAAALGQLGGAAANQSSNTYLSNLLNNEQVKFQAAQGLTGLGNMMSGQNTVGATPQPVQTTFGSSANALGQSLTNLLGQTGTTNGTQVGGNNGILLGDPVTQGYYGEGGTDQGGGSG